MWVTLLRIFGASGTAKSIGPNCYKAFKLGQASSHLMFGHASLRIDQSHRVLGSWFSKTLAVLLYLSLNQSVRQSFSNLGHTSKHWLKVSTDHSHWVVKLSSIDYRPNLKLLDQTFTKILLISIASQNWFQALLGIFLLSDTYCTTISTNFKTKWSLQAFSRSRMLAFIFTSKDWFFSN